MSDRSLKGTRLGVTSYENESLAELAPRQSFEFKCPNGHTTSVTFAEEGDAPGVWECRTCGAQARRQGGRIPEQRAVRPVRTHWDMLLERRSVDDLELLLNERLEWLRSEEGADTPHADHHRSAAEASRRKKSA